MTVHLWAEWAFVWLWKQVSRCVFWFQPTVVLESLKGPKFGICRILWKRKQGDALFRVKRWEKKLCFHVCIKMNNPNYASLNNKPSLLLKSSQPNFTRTILGQLTVSKLCTGITASRIKFLGQVENEWHWCLFVWQINCQTNIKTHTLGLLNSDKKLILITLQMHTDWSMIEV